MSEPTFSVIVPAYNSAATIGRALDSVFAQGATDFEVLVIDDGSKDDLDTALAPYAGRLTLIRQANAGAAAARNTGVRAARGRLLAFLDADDFWHPAKLALQREAFRRHADLALCYTDSMRLAPDEVMRALAVTVPADSAALRSADFGKIFERPYLGTPGVVIPRELFMQLGGFREDLETAEDVDLWLRATYGRSFARIPQPLFFIVTSPHSLTSRLLDRTYRDNLRVIEEFCAAHPRFAHDSRRAVALARAKVLENWGSDALIKRNLPLAKQLLRRSLGDRLTFRAALLFSKVLLAERRPASLPR